MYPEEVYVCCLPLPYELMKPIAFQVAYEHIKEKLRFPEQDLFHLECLWYILKVKEPTDEDMKGVCFYWEDHNYDWFTVSHIDYNGDARRKYRYCKDNGRASIEIYCPSMWQY